MALRLREPDANDAQAAGDQDSRRGQAKTLVAQTAAPANASKQSEE